MRAIPLYAMAHARSGDKGDASNVGVLAYDDRGYEILRDWLTPARVKGHFQGIVLGEVERFEMANLRALNFILHDSLGGGGSASLKNDAQGKTHAGGNCFTKHPSLHVSTGLVLSAVRHDLEAASAKSIGTSA